MPTTWAPATMKQLKHIIIESYTHGGEGFCSAIASLPRSHFFFVIIHFCYYKWNYQIIMFRYARECVCILCSRQQYNTIQCKWNCHAQKRREKEREKMSTDKCGTTVVICDYEKNGKFFPIYMTSYCYTHCCFIVKLWTQHNSIQLNWIPQSHTHLHTHTHLLHGFFFAPSWLLLVTSFCLFFWSFSCRSVGMPYPIIMYYR